MAHMPTVSVLMPVYNAEKYLCEAIESILNQTYGDFEFIIINDGSFDRSAEIIRSYDDHRIRYMENERNLKLAIALNRGIDTARGKYIARMDADDVSLPNRLTEQVAFLDDHPKVGLLSTNYSLIDENGVVQSEAILRGTLSAAWIEWELYWGNPIVHPSVMVRANVVRGHGGYPYNYRYYAEDYALWLRIISDTPVAIMKQSLLNLRKHDHNATLISLSDHLTEVIFVAQSALAERVGFTPSLQCIRLIRHLALDTSISPSDITQARKLLLRLFQGLAKRYDHERESLSEIRIDLATRLMSLAGLYGDRSRTQAMLSQIQALGVSPETSLLALDVNPVVVRVIRRFNRMKHHLGLRFGSNAI